MLFLGDFLHDGICWIFVREERYGLYFYTIVWIWNMLLAGFVMVSACCNWIFIFRQVFMWKIGIFFLLWDFFFFLVDYNNGGRDSNLSSPADNATNEKFEPWVSASFKLLYSHRDHIDGMNMFCLLNNCAIDVQ